MGYTMVERSDVIVILDRHGVPARRVYVADYDDYDAARDAAIEAMSRLNRMLRGDDGR